MSEKRIPHNKLTWEQVRESFIEVHGEGTYGYDDVVYVDTHTPINIYCFRHKEHFPQIPKIHKKGAGCNKCAQERISKIHSKGREQFAKEGVELYGDRDDYSKVDYINCKKEVIITCKIHGDYEVTPDIYLHQNGICPKCKHRKTRSNDKETFIISAIKKHGDDHDYTDTIVESSYKEVEIRCKKHDHKFTMNLYAYLGGQKCPKCSAEIYSDKRMKTTETYIQEAIEVYGDSNDYSETKYQGVREYLNVRCIKHDYTYTVLPGNHINGQDCPKCKKERNKFVGGHHTKDEYVKFANGRETFLYLIKCTDKYEEFYKIGKTFRGLNKRFTNSNMPYDYEKLFLYAVDASTIWDLEELLHEKYSPYKYTVNKTFDGYSECYNHKLPVKEIINL